MQAGLQLRHKQEMLLRKEVARLQPVFASLVKDARRMAASGDEAGAMRQLEEARAFVRRRTEALLYPGAEPGARDAYLER